MINLIKIIKENVKANYQAKLDEKNKLIKNIANFGAKNGSKGMVGRNGEYYGLTVEFLSDVKPLITDDRIIRSLEAINREDFNMAIIILGIEEYEKYGNNILFYAIEEWFKINNIDSKHLENIKNYNLNYDKTKILPDNCTIKRLKILRRDPINVPIRIVGLGSSKKGNCVVPEFWLGKEFNSGEELHNQMNELDWRKGKPPVSYCCIYSMSLIEDTKWITKKEIIGVKIDNKSLIMITCFIIKDRIKSKVYFGEDHNDFIKDHENDVKYYYDTKKNLLICISSKIFKPKSVYKKDQSVSVLISRLQKSFRRGSGSSKILYDTIEELNDAHFYNIPDQHYAKVSGTRQLFWRSYISIIEDVCGYYHKNMYDLMDIFILSLICHINPEIQIENKFIDQFRETLLNVQNINTYWEWRKGIEVPIKKFKTYGLICDQDPLSRMTDSMILALQFMPMMFGDRIMLSKCINLIAENHYNPNNIIHRDTNYYLSLSKEYIERDVMLSGIDIHCYHNMILSLQGSIPFIPTDEYTTCKISGFIWNNSSKFNIRYSKKKILTKEQENVVSVMRTIQENYLEKINIEEIDNIVYYKNKYNKILKNDIIPIEISRLGFILLFGQKIRLPSEGKNKPCIEVIVAGNELEPCKIKKYSNDDKYNYLQANERYEGEKRYVKYIEKGIIIEVPLPPIGYKWGISKKAKIRASITESHFDKNINEIDFYVNNIKIKPFTTLLLTSLFLIYRAFSIILINCLSSNSISSYSPTGSKNILESNGLILILFT